ncbi:MAG: hypothetical protein ACREDM_08675 [Methylocella sp.]
MPTWVLSSGLASTEQSFVVADVLTHELFSGESYAESRIFEQAARFSKVSHALRAGKSS